jgi:hypothetical protein
MEGVECYPRVSFRHSFLDSTKKHSASLSCLASYAAVPEPKEPQAPRTPHDTATMRMLTKLGKWWNS